MAIVPQLKDVINDVFREFGQSDKVKKQFLHFFENLTTNNTGPHDLEDLVESIELSEEEIQ